VLAGGIQQREGKSGARHEQDAPQMVGRGRGDHGLAGDRGGHGRGRWGIATGIMAERRLLRMLVLGIGGLLAT